MITTSRTYKAVAPSHSSPGCKHTALSTSTFWTHTKFAYSGLSDHGFQTCSNTLKVSGGQAESCTHSQVSKATAALNEHAAACAHFNGHPGGCCKVCAAQGSPATDGENYRKTRVHSRTAHAAMAPCQCLFLIQVSCRPNTCNPGAPKARRLALVCLHPAGSATHRNHDVVVSYVGHRHMSVQASCELKLFGARVADNEA